MDELIFKLVNKVGIIKINRPKALNALNRLLVDSLDSLLERITNTTHIRALIIGSIDNFAAGADIREMVDCNKLEAEAFSFSRSFQRIDNLPIPTIAAIDGFALGGGLELALACDFRIATKTAKLGFPEINLGIMPGAGGTIRAPRLIGESKAKEMILFGEIIDGIKAKQIGLINKVVEQDQLMETAMEWADKLCNKPPIALKAAKSSIKDGMSEPRIDKAITIECEKWTDLFNTEDQKEGMKAFIEKRKPVFLNK